MKTPKSRLEEYFKYLYYRYYLLTTLKPYLADYQGQRLCLGSQFYYYTISSPHCVE